MRISKHPFYFLFLVFIASCGGDDGDTGNPILDACGNETTESVNDKRCLYTVSTLTASFNGSGGLAVGPDDFIYVGDFGNQINNADGSTVSKIDPLTGAVSIFASGLNGPSGNTFGPNGNLFQANIQGSFISEITPDGQVSTFSSDGLINPVGVVFDSNGNLFANNCGGGGSVLKFDENGSSTVFSNSALLACPNGLTIDENDNLYIANFNNSNILKITPDGTISVLATLPGNNNSHLVYGNGVIYALSRVFNKLYEVTLTGEVSIIAGSSPAGNRDGDGHEASFFIPNGIGISNDGTKIYVISRLVGQGSPLNPVLVRVIEKK